MANIFLAERGVLAVAVEDTKGTLKVPTTADGAIEVYDVSYDPRVDHHERNPMRRSLSRPEGVPEKEIVEVTFRVPVKGHPAAGSRPEWDKLMRGCATAVTVVGGTSVAYKPVTDTALQENVTIFVYRDGVVYKAKGCAGNVRETVRQGGIPMWEFSFMGVYEPEATASVPAVTYLLLRPPAVKALTLSYRSVNLRATGYDFDMGNEITAIDNAGAASGVDHFVVTDRDPTISVDPKLEALTTFDFWSNLVSGASGEFKCILGSTVGNIHTFLASLCQITEAPEADQNGVLIRNLTLKPRELTSAGDDEWSDTIT